MNIKLNGYNLLTSKSCRIYLHFSVTFQWLLIKIIIYKVYFSSVYTFIFLFLPQYLALFDLVHLSQFSLTRRKQIFSLSQPSEIYFNICPYCSRCKFPILVHNFSLTLYYIFLSNSENHHQLDPFTPMSDQDIISPYSINILLSKQLIRIAKKLLTRWLSFDPTPNLRTNFIRNIWLIVRRNFIKILEMKGLTTS